MPCYLPAPSSSSISVSALLCLVAVQLPWMICTVVKLEETSPSVTSSAELPHLPSVRPAHVKRNTLLYHILSRLCKFHNTRYCPDLSSSVNASALYHTRPDSDHNTHTLGQLGQKSDTKKQQKYKPTVHPQQAVHITDTENLAKTEHVNVSSHISVYFPKLAKRGRFRYNKKVFVYGEDNRSPVYGPRMRRYPYSNVVRLSSGCTGTLLTPLHVLTAAHCVHNGEEFRNNLQMLKVEVPATMGFRVYYVEKISIPIPWLRRSSMGETARSSYDYAIVRLSFAVAGRKRFMPLTVPKANILNEDTYFLAFKSIYDPVLWSSQCHSHSNMALMDGHLLVTRCDSSVGNSGAAVFTDDPREGRRIIGIISNSRSVASMSFVTRYSIITALTWSKLFEVCSMVAPYGQRYGVCPSFSYMPVATHEPVDNRIIPFFG